MSAETLSKSCRFLMNIDSEKRADQKTGPLRRSRVGREIIDLYEKALVGFLLGAVLRVAVDAVIIGLLLYLVHRGFQVYAPADACAQNCFASAEGQCCAVHPLVIARTLLCLAVVAVGSFLSTKFKKRDKFQHSASVTAILVTFTAMSLLRWNASWLALFAAVAAVFLASFFGYSLWFRVRKRR